MCSQIWLCNKGRRAMDEHFYMSSLTIVHYSPFSQKGTEKFTVRRIIQIEKMIMTIHVGHILQYAIQQKKTSENVNIYLYNWTNERKLYSTSFPQFCTSEEGHTTTTCLKGLWLCYFTRNLVRLQNFIPFYYFIRQNCHYKVYLNWFLAYKSPNESYNLEGFGESWYTKDIIEHDIV